MWEGDKIYFYLKSIYLRSIMGGGVRISKCGV